jgi:hypothetical protein
LLKQGNSKSQKAFQILKCFFVFRATNTTVAFFEFMLRISWEFPQQLSGVVYALLINSFGLVDGVGIIDGALLVRTNFGGGMTLGNVITSSSPTLDKHEWGHTMQSKIFGPLYIPVFGIPSFVRATGIEGLKALGYLKSFKDSDYYRFYAESFADYLSNRFLSRP